MNVPTGMLLHPEVESLMMVMVMMMKVVNNLTGMLLLEVESVSSGLVEIGGGLLGVRRPSWKEKKLLNFEPQNSFEHGNKEHNLYECKESV